MEPVQFLQYEKITDDLYYLGKNVVLRFNVGLATHKDDKRYFFHREYEYEKNGNKAVTIRRKYDYYLSLENPVDYGNGKEYIIVGVREFFRFKSAIEECIKWFTDKKYKGLFVQAGNKLTMTSPIPTYELSSLPGNKYIRFDPVVIEYGETINDKQPGISIALSNPNNFTNINVDTLMGLYYIIKDLNMLLIAQSMIASLNIPTGCNRTVISDKSSSNYNNHMRREERLNNKPIVNRKIQSVPSNAVSGIEGRRIQKNNKLEVL